MVLSLHGIGGTPEMVLGFDDTDPPSYFAFGRALHERNAALACPRFLNTFKDRNTCNRMALLLGTSLMSIELYALETAYLYLTETYPIQRTAVWGLSMGGAHALYFLALRNDIDAGIVLAWFNHRTRKMVVPDSRYSCFIDTEEEHAFLPGLLSHFSDKDLVSLVCPRPLCIQTGRKDPVSDAELVAKEFEVSKSHYHRLGHPDRLHWHVHEHGHQVDVEDGLTFLDQYFFNL